MIRENERESRPAGLKYWNNNKQQHDNINKVGLPYQSIRMYRALELIGAETTLDRDKGLLHLGHVGTFGSRRSLSL
jgi:hypothetical protein